MSEAQKEAHARRRANGSDTFKKTRFTSGWEWSEEQKSKTIKPCYTKRQNLETC